MKFFNSKSEFKEPKIVKGMNKKSSSKNNENIQLFPSNHKNRSCFLCVGSKNAAQAQIITHMTQCKYESTGNLCDFYSDESDDKVYVNVQVDWKEEKYAQIPFITKGLLENLENQGITEIKAVIWTIIPTYHAKDPILAKQACLINSIADEKIWKNTIVVCKQSQKPERDGKEALRAVQDLDATCQPHCCIGITIPDEEKQDGNQSQEHWKELEKCLDSIITHEKPTRLKLSIQDLDLNFASDDDHVELESKKVKTFFNLPPIVLPKPF